MGLRIWVHVRPGEEVGPRARVGEPLPSGGNSGLELCEARVGSPTWKLAASWVEGGGLPERPWG